MFLTLIRAKRKKKQQQQQKQRNIRVLINKTLCSVQLEQTQKELNRVKELYIDVCGTKEKLINDHRDEMKVLKDKYATVESYRRDMEKAGNELQTQIKLCNKLTAECEGYKSKIMELEKEMTHERRKKEDYVKKIHSEIEKGKGISRSRAE